MYIAAHFMRICTTSCLYHAKQSPFYYFIFFFFRFGFFLCSYSILFYWPVFSSHAVFIPAVIQNQMTFSQFTMMKMFLSAVAAGEANMQLN